MIFFVANSSTSSPQTNIIETPDGGIDLSGYYTSSQVDTKLFAYVKNVDLNRYKNEVTDEISNQINSIQIPSLEPYVKTEDLPMLPDFTQYVERSALPDFTQYVKKNELPSLSGYATEVYVSNTIENKLELLEDKLNNELSTYAKNYDVDNALRGKANLDEINNALMGKMSIVSANNELNLKLNIRDANIQFDTKADKTELNNALIEERGMSDNKYFHKTENPTSALYGLNGLTSLRPKIWTGTVLSNDSDVVGGFTVDFSSAGFTTPPTVVVSAQSTSAASDTSANNANWASISKDSISTTGCRGRVKSADTAGLLAAMVSVNKSGIIVNVIAIGI